MFVEGRLTVDPETGGPRTWQSQDGSWRASYEVTALEVKFLGQRGDSGGYDNGGSHAAADDSPGITEDEIPF